MTAFDGYYVISVIPPGDYLLMVRPDDLADTGLRQPRPQLVHIGYDGKVLADKHITLERGMETPLRFIKTLKGQAAPADSVAVEFGTYKSQLMAQIVKLRVRGALRDAGVKQSIEVIETTTNDTRGFKLVGTMDHPDVEHAYDVCRAASRRNLNCEILLTPSLLMKRPETVTRDMTPAKTQG
jgi:hypothetical protein